MAVLDNGVRPVNQGDGPIAELMTGRADFSNEVAQQVADAAVIAANAPEKQSRAQGGAPQRRGGDGQGDVVPKLTEQQIDARFGELLGLARTEPSNRRRHETELDRLLAATDDNSRAALQKRDADWARIGGRQLLDRLAAAQNRVAITLGEKMDVDTASEILALANRYVDAAPLSADERRRLQAYPEMMGALNEIKALNGNPMFFRARRIEDRAHDAIQPSATLRDSYAMYLADVGQSGKALVMMVQSSELQRRDYTALKMQ